MLPPTAGKPRVLEPGRDTMHPTVADCGALPIRGVLSGRRMARAKLCRVRRAPAPERATVLVNADGAGALVAARIDEAGDASLRVGVSGRAPSDIRSRPARAPRGSARRRGDPHPIETPGSETVEVFRAAGFAATEPSQVFEIDVARSGAAIPDADTLIRRLGGPRLVTLDRTALAPVAAALHAAQLMDDFELSARLSLTGVGGIDPTECPVMIGRQGLMGLVLVMRTDRADTREVAARWVAPECRSGPLPNLCLMQHCLRLAAAARVRHALFAANPQRHRDTAILARRLGGCRTGTRLGLSKRRP